MDRKHAHFKLLNFLLFLTGLSYATTWLPLLRGLFDGPSYSWGTVLFSVDYSGTGIHGDFYYVVVNAIIGILLLYAFYWIRQRWLLYGLLILWHGSMILNAFYEVFFGQGYYFHGDTLGVHLNLSYVIIPYMVGLGYLVVLVIFRDSHIQFHPLWTKRNNIWLAILALPLPLQYFLLSSGEPHGLTDQIGVVLALLQVLLISGLFRAYSIKSGSTGDS